MINNWYIRSCQSENLDSLEKEAGISRDISSLVFGIALFLGGNGASLSAQESGVPEIVIEKQARNPEIAKRVRPIPDLRGLSNEEKKRLLDSWKAQQYGTDLRKEPEIKKENRQENKLEKESPKSINNLSPLDILARTIYAEAEGEPYEGKKAVASVIYNRAGGDVGKMPYVVTKKYQFSCWNGGTPAKGKGKAWDDCVKLAEELISGNFSPTTKHTHYYNPRKANPTWARNVKDKTVINNHVFLTPSNRR